MYIVYIMYKIPLNHVNKVKNNVKPVLGTNLLDV